MPVVPAEPRWIDILGPPTVVCYWVRFFFEGIFLVQYHLVQLTLVLMVHMEHLYVSQIVQLDYQRITLLVRCFGMVDIGNTAFCLCLNGWVLGL